jgi:hypothetical protein
MDVVEGPRSRLVGRSQRCIERAYTSISIDLNNTTGCFPNRAKEISLATVPTTFYSYSSFYPIYHSSYERRRALRRALVALGHSS